MRQQVIFGGSFNPFHNGHLALVKSVLKDYPLCELRIIPTGKPPHKNAELAPDNHRISMIHAALNNLDRWVIDYCEIEREGTSYTIETIEDLESRGLLVEKPYFMIGDDWVESFHQWKHVDQLIEKIDLLVFHRKSREILPFDFPHQYLNNPIVSVSSSEIRERIGKKKSIKDLVPPSVEAYIEQYELYRA